MRIIKDCNLKYRECTAGDVRVALCFRDAGIFLTPNIQFNAFPPSVSNLHDPCSKPLTFHHLLPFHFEELNYLDGHEVTTSKLFDYYLTKNSDLFAGAGHIEIDTDRIGGDYKKIGDVLSPRDCYVMCKEEKECVAFTYLSSSCWLKRWIPEAIFRKGSYSGAFPERFICNKQ